MCVLSSVCLDIKLQYLDLDMLIKAIDLGSKSVSIYHRISLSRVFRLSSRSFSTILAIIDPEA